ncbi:hypothetical protein CTAYLR_004977 [Chrysophaeum taylorii]|uniref:Protein-L-isoaspartate O-methyltransferase n=1 Tax=Chrysophaeum taylorii TaxID=2483200 RepID=A0AAD7XNV3_9STRA|nr:hypothetical protein CTAYLR_004977 [Chrysophaeum taylorii]
MGRLNRILIGLLARQSRGWYSSGASNEELVNNLVRDGAISSDHVAAVMRRIDRRPFTKTVGGRVAEPREAYRDAPVPIADGATISAPHMHARALELLAPVLKPQSKALDVGCGSGYLTVALALVSPDVKAYGLEHTQSLVDLSTSNVMDAEFQGLLGTNINFYLADGWRGLPDVAPFDAIHVGAAAHSVPQALVDQLKPGGRMVIPVGLPNAPQQLVQIDKRTDGSLHVTQLFGVRYVELVDSAPAFRTKIPFPRR